MSKVKALPNPAHLTRATASVLLSMLALLIGSLLTAGKAHAGGTVKSGTGCVNAYTCVTLVNGTALGQFNISWAGSSLQVLVAYPTTTTTTKAPLLIVLHANGMSPTLTANTIQAAQLAASQGFYVAIPASPGHWNYNPDYTSGPDDVGYINSLITTLISKYPVNSKKVSLAGFSEGAYMTEYMACVSPDALASVAIVAATMTNPEIGVCTPNRPLPIVYILGTDDPIVNYDGASEQYSASQDFSYWMGMLACNTSKTTQKTLPVLVDDGTTVSQETNSTCTSGGWVELYTVTGGGHAWPGSPLPTGGFGIASQNLNATSVIGTFANKWNTSSTN